MVVQRRQQPQPRFPDAGPGRVGGIPVGISQCLLGFNVRFDGGHKRDDFCVETLGEWFSFTPVCPEMAIGLGAPREAVHLTGGAVAGDGSQPVRLIGIKSGRDHTAAMREFSERTAMQLADLCGYIVAKRSPTCGMERVKVYNDAGMTGRTDARGIYTDIFMRSNPLIPVEEEGRLNDPQLRESFVTRVFVLWRWRQLRAHGVSARALVEFHTAHKYLLMAHSVPAYRATGKMLAHLAGRDLDAIADAYIAALMAGLAQPVSRQGHANVLQHILGYFKTMLPAPHRQRLHKLIHDYREGLVPFAAPMTLVQHFLADFPDAYLAKQHYLNPHPETLALRAFQ